DPDGADLMPTGKSPIVWSPDGARLFVLTHGVQPDSSGGNYLLWVLGGEGTAPHAPVQLGFAPWRPDVSPDGATLYILGYDPDLSTDPTNTNVIARGPAFVSVVDAQTGTERVRIRLYGLQLGQRSNLDSILDPDVALGPDGYRYYVLHAEAP